MDVALFFNQLTTTLSLGPPLCEALRVQGGLLHTMYRLDTMRGSYAVKLLNPSVMKRPEAMANFSEADRLESLLQTEKIPMVPSLLFDGKKMQELDGQYCYVYEWFEGKALQDKDITTLHCQKIGAALSRIHGIEMKQEQPQRSPMQINWDSYRALAKEQGSVLFALLEAHQELLSESQSRGNSALSKLPAAIAICHNDMDRKNVLWHNDAFRLIDLECLGYASPYLELFELALCWSGYEECRIDFKRFSTFIKAYFGDRPKPGIDWEALYDSNNGRLAWLEYNVKRALSIECGTQEEKVLGIEQAKETINHVIYYHHAKDEILGCLREIVGQ